jgi:hypothetical protein
MLTEHERDRLIDEYRGRPVSALGRLITCAGGLLMVIALVLIGIDLQLFMPSPQHAVAAQVTR